MCRRVKTSGTEWCGERKMSHNQRGQSVNARGRLFRARGRTSEALRTPALTFRGNLGRAVVKGVLQGIKNSPKIDIKMAVITYCQSLLLL